ncbi:hypothetical protein QJQ45_019316, partial [Haematococcus lacustris]
AKLPEPMASITSGSRQPPFNLPACANVELPPLHEADVPVYNIVQLTPLHETSAQIYFAPDGTAAGGLQQAGKQPANIATTQADKKPTQPMPPTDQTAKSSSQPSIMTAALKQARDLQQWLLSNPHGWDVLLSNKRHHSSPGILQVMAQPALQLGWQHGSTQGMVPVVCVPCEGQGSSPPLPPPFIANFCDNSGCGIVWKEPDWPWSSIAGQWHSMEWAANGPQGQLVLGLKAASKPCPAGAGGTGPSGSATRAAGQAAGSMPQPGTVRHLIRLAKQASDQLLGSPHAVPITMQIINSVGKPYFLHVSDHTDVGMAGQAAGSMTQPGTARDLIRLAKEASDQLHDDPDARAINEQIEKSDGKPYFLHVSNQADVGMDCGLNRAVEVVPVLCVPGSSWPNPPQPPPPFHIRRLANERQQAAQQQTGIRGLPHVTLLLALCYAGSTQSSKVTLGRMMCWAKHVQEKLLLSPGVLHGHQTPVSTEYCQYLLRFMAQPALQQPGNRDEHRQAVHAMICVTHDGQPTLQQLPSPLLFTRRGDSDLRLFWKDPCGTWSSLMQHWVEVKWIVTSLARQWVLGLKAAGSTRPAAVSLSSQLNPAAPAAATPPPPYPQQQSAGVQQASMTTQPAPAAPEAPALPTAAPALPSGPEPHLGHAPCPGGAQGASHGAAHPLSAGPSPGNADGSGQAAADTLQGQGEVPGRTAAESSGMNQSGIKLEPGLQPGACGTAETGQGRGTREEPIELSDDTSDEADADDDQDMDVMAPMSGDNAPSPAALPESPGTAGTCMHLDSTLGTTALLLAAHGQAPVAPDVAGPSSAPGPAAAPASLAAAALVATAVPGNDPLPHVPEWSSYCVGTRADLSDRCLETLPSLVVKHLGLKHAERSCVPIQVALALERPHALGADHGHGSLCLLYFARPDTRGRWSDKRVQLNAWVTKSRFQLTGRFKARRAGPEQAGPHLLVLEVRPLPQAAAQAACATPGQSQLPGPSLPSPASLVAVSTDAMEQQLLDAPPTAPHALPFSSAKCPAPHARDGVVGQADPGSQGSSLRNEHAAAAPLHQASAINNAPSPWIDCIVCKREEEEHPQPASLADAPIKLLPAAQPAMASTPSLAQATDAGSRTEPDGGQGNQAPPPAASEPACPSVEADSAQPETVCDCLMMAEALQQQLLAGGCAWLEAAAPVPVADSLHILTGMATAASKVDLQSGRDSSMVPVVCVPWDVALEAGSWGLGALLAGVPAPLPAAAAAADVRPDFVIHPPQEIQTLQMEAVVGQQALAVAITPGPQDGSHHTRHLMATAAPRLEWHSGRDTSLDAAVCVRHGGQSTSPQLPPPFLARIHGSSWELLWKAPDFPWSSMLQLWEAIKWVGKAPGESLVLGLRAASSPGSTALDPTSMHTPQVLAALPCPPPRTPHQQGQGAQLAATARQMPVTACGATTPPVATPAPPCGPGPLHGLQDCSDVKPDPGQQPDPMAAKDLLVTVGAMMDEHLPASEMPMFKEAYKRMEEWVNSPDGAAQLVELGKAYTWNLLMFEGRTSKTTAWTLWESIQRILGQTPAATSSSNAAHDLAAMQEELVGHSARPGTQSVTPQWQAAAVAATAWPEADPQPHIDSWTQLKGFTDRSLEYLPKPLALQFGLHESGADKVELLVVLAHHSGSTGADQGPGCLQLPYEATRRPDGRWSLKARSPQSVKISTWVKNCGLALTGRCKAQRAEPGQAVERLLVLEVRPLNEAAASAGQATPGQSSWHRGGYEFGLHCNLLLLCLARRGCLAHNKNVKLKQ